LIGVLGDTVLPETIVRARRPMIFQVIKTRTAIRFEDERNGQWFDTVAYPVIDERGTVQKIAVIARDITDRKRIEEALRQSEGKLHAMLQSITDPMSMMDKDLTIIWTNDTARQYFGNDIVGRKCYDAFHQRHSPCEPYPCLTLKAFQDGKMHRHETTVIDMQGKTRSFDCTANVALRDEHGRPTAVLEISRDITEWKKTEEALRRRS
jgi:PAS domain S-box-containing protein